MLENSKLWQRTPRNGVVGVFGGPACRDGLARFPDKLAHVNRTHAACGDPDGSHARCVRRALIFDFALRTDLKFGCF